MKKAILFRFINDRTCSNTIAFSCAIKLLFWIVTTLAVIGISFAEEGEKTSRILYINSYSPGYSWSDDIKKGLLERFKLSDKKIELSIEYLDSKRFKEQVLQNQQADIMHTKYAEYHHDLVIVSDNNAFNFAIKNRQRLFPDIPVVFCGYNIFRPDVLKGLTNITGVNEEIDIEGVVETALHIQPKIRTLAFILSTDNASTKPMGKKVETLIIPKYKDQYKIVTLKNASMTEIRETLARLPRESALFLTGRTIDTGKGRALTPVENGRLICAASPIPAYSFWSFHLGTGILGGRILTGYDQGKAAGDMALQILNGKSADSIPVLMQSPTSNIFDYTVMKRFNIAMDALPENSVVINKPYSFYEINKKIVWSTLSVLATLIAFIIALYLNVLRRQHAEKELQKHRDHLEYLIEERTVELSAANKGLKESEERFREMARLLPNIILEINLNHRATYINNLGLETFGYTQDEFDAGINILDLIHPDDRKKAAKRIEQLVNGVAIDPLEYRFLRKDGSELVAYVNSSPVYKDGRISAVRASMTDITEHKRTEQEKEKLINKLEEALANVKTLRGLIPICSSCKKIRDDKGYWNQIEIYIHEHSEAEFSHGICPECSDKLYENEDWYIKMKNDNKQKE